MSIIMNTVLAAAAVTTTGTSTITDRA
jgi:hypothetical protein